MWDVLERAFAKVGFPSPKNENISSLDNFLKQVCPFRRLATVVASATTELICLKLIARAGSSHLDGTRFDISNGEQLCSVQSYGY